MNANELRRIIQEYTERLWPQYAEHRARVDKAIRLYRGESMTFPNFPICTCGTNINPFMYVHRHDCPVAIQASGELPDGKVTCPATHDVKKVCVLCKNTNLVNER